MKNFLILLNLLLLPSLASAEYRVYQYYVKSKVLNLVPTPPYVVTSTLNPVSYLAYHGGKESLDISLLRSWQCMGNTAKQEVCAISEGKEFDESKQ